MFPLLEVFCAQKIIGLVILCLLIFVLLVDFCLFCIFEYSEPSRLKKKTDPKLAC